MAGSESNSFEIESRDIVVIGKAGTGKSAIINALENLLFVEVAQCIFKREKKLEIRNEELSFCLSEMSLEDPFDPYSLRDVTKAHAYILVYSVDDDTSFGLIEQVKDFILSKRGEAVPIIVVGNKSDAAERELLFEYADLTVSVGWEIKFIETSAITGMNINMILPTLIDAMSESGEDAGTFVLKEILFKKSGDSSPTSRASSWFSRRFSRKKPKSPKQTPEERREDKISPNRSSIRNVLGRMMSTRHRSADEADKPCRSPTVSSLSRLLSNEENNKVEFNFVQAEMSPTHAGLV